MQDTKEKEGALLKSNFLSPSGQLSNLTISGDVGKSDADFRLP